MDKNDKEIAIKLSNVKKMYKLGQIGGGTLQGDIQSWWARKRGKEDPNSKIGSDQRLFGQKFMALNGIDLTIYKGEALGIIGKNGAGKSTLLKLLSRVTAPTEGTIEIYGRITSMLEVGTGFHGEMTGKENIYMNGAILGMSKAEIDSKIDQIVEFSEVRDFIDTPVKRYSSGMYVKLAFSVASHLDSEIMIMDEVLAVGDMAFQKKCLTKMREAASNEGRTILYVSHNMNTIRQLCDRCIVLDEGKIIFDGEVEDAIDIYMKTSEDADISKDFSTFKRSVWLNQKVKLLSACYRDKANNVFSCYEKMKMRLRWEILKPVDSLGIRLEVWSLDNTPQATYIIFEINKSVESGIYEADLLLDLSNLVPASYKFVFTFFEEGILGGNGDVDCITGLVFKISQEESSSFVWRPKSWGYICLPKPEVQQIRKLDND